MSTTNEPPDDTRPADDTQRPGDIAQLAAKRVPPAATMADALADAMADLSLTAPADAQHVTELRHTLRDWLKSQQLPETLVADILLAANEALTNVVDHAYPDNQGPFTLSVRRTPATLTVRIADQGNWRPEPTDPGTRGRGLRILRAVAEAMDIDSRPDGTTVTARFALPVSPTPH